MRKLIAVGVLIGGLLAVAGAEPARAQGNKDPLSLAASGVLIPFITSSVFNATNPGTAVPFVALVEVASPVGLNDGRSSTRELHLVFFNNTCDRVGSASLPLTTNDIGFVDVGQILSPLANVNGLVGIASTALGNELVPLSNPIHSRVYEFGIVDGRSRVHEPIIIDSFEFPSATDNWSPLRTAATFFAPQETASVKTVLTLICPRNTIQNFSTQNLGAFPILPTAPNTLGFPTITPRFNPGTTPMSGRVYDTNEVLLRDITFVCDCLTEISVVAINSIYGSSGDPLNGGIGASLGTYTEIEVTDPNPSTGASSGSFTGYRSVSTIGSSNNNFFGRLSNGSRSAINSGAIGVR